MGNFEKINKTTNVNRIGHIHTTCRHNPHKTLTVRSQTHHTHVQETGI